MVALLVGLRLGRQLDRRPIYRPLPPAAPDTVVVQQTDTAAVAELTALLDRQRDRIARLQTDQNTVRTVYISTPPDTIKVCDSERLPRRWYIDRLTAGRFYGDTATLTATRLESTPAGSLLRQQETVNLFSTGPLQAAVADSAGYQMLFDPEGFPEPGCGFWCQAQMVLGCAAGAVVGASIGNEAGAALGTLGGCVVGRLSQ